MSNQYDAWKLDTPDNHVKPVELCEVCGDILDHVCIMERWRPVVGFEGRYQVSDLGKIYSQVRGKLMKPSLHPDGYHTIRFSKDGKTSTERLHQVVAKAFLDNPEGKPQVNHKNGCKTDNRLENLEWSTAWENNIHALMTGARGSTRRPNLSMEEVRAIRQAHKDGEGIREIGKRLNLLPSTIFNIVNNKTYREE